MVYTFDAFVVQVRQAIAETGRVPDALIEVTAPKPNIPADLAFPAFRAAKQLGMNPVLLAQELAAAITLAPGSLIGSVKAAGPFLNFALDTEAFATSVLNEIHTTGMRYGHDTIGADRSIVIDYSAPNIAKTMHVGHIRSTIIGQALYNIFSALGYNVIGDNHLGDWGKQFGVNIAAIAKWGKPEAEGEEAIAQIDKLYAEYNKLLKASLEQGDTSFDDQARSWSLKLEQGDPTARDLWQWMVDLTMAANKPNYDRLGVRFDHAYGESFYAPMTDTIIQEALESKVAYRDDTGAVVVSELENNMPTFLLQRSDSGTLYHTRDAATIKFRWNEFHPNQIIYVVDARQELHFRQLFVLVKALGYVPEDLTLVHVKFGTVYDQNGKVLSTRAGNMIYLADLLNEAHARARAVVDQASRDLDEAEKERIAEAVGIGSVIYNDLYQDPRRDIRLDWDKMLALDGNSAPYIQYMHARCRSILRRAGEEEFAGGRLHTADQADNVRLLTHPAEVAVVKQLAKLPAALREAGERYATFVIADWCYETARALSTFYRDCPVLKAEPDLRAARLYLVAATAQALENGLGLLGIRAPERM